MKGNLSVPAMNVFLFIFMSFPQKRVHICTLRWPDTTAEIVWNVAFTALCFLLPGFIIVVSYSKILQVGFLCSLAKMSGSEERHCLKDS